MPLTNCDGACAFLTRQIQTYLLLYYCIILLFGTQVINRIVTDFDLQGLEYLHHDCDPPITHRDIKSNNILLDLDYQAHVADFGLAKVLEYATGDLESMSHVAGSHGYIAPGE